MANSAATNAEEFASAPQRVAFYGRVAHGDESGALNSLLRQRRRVNEWVAANLPPTATIVADYADIGPWNGLSGSLIRTYCLRLGGHQVVGGLRALLDRVRRGEHDFDLVACVGCVVLSRRYHDLRQIENELCCHGVRIAYTDQPTGASDELEPLCKLHVGLS